MLRQLVRSARVGPLAAVQRRIDTAGAVESQITTEKESIAMDNGTAVAEEVTERIHALETAQATQAASTAGMESTNAATTAGLQAAQATAQAGTWAVMIASGACLIVGTCLGMAIKAKR